MCAIKVNMSEYCMLKNIDPLQLSIGNIHVWSAVECRTLNRESHLLPFRSLGIFVLSTTPHFTNQIWWVRVMARDLVGASDI